MSYLSTVSRVRVGLICNMCHFHVNMNCVAPAGFVSIKIPGTASGASLGYCEQISVKWCIINLQRCIDFTRFHGMV